MSPDPFPISIVVPVNDEDVYISNFLSSPMFLHCSNFEIIKQVDYFSASVAYNDAIKKAKNDILVFVHQDIVLPEDWKNKLDEALIYLENNDNKWGVIGCYGVSREGIHKGFVYCSGNERILGNSFLEPTEVRTLDEIVLILKKSSGLRFDEFIPGYHFYGTQICLEAERKGMKCYAIPAFCLHNSNKIEIYTSDFIRCYRYMKRNYKMFLPFETPCLRVEYANINLINKYSKQILYKYFLKYIKNERKNMNRTNDPITLLNKIKTF